MQIKSLTLKNFRCFENYEISFNFPITLISGPNGSGKSSILEALHYACYLRSFRANSPKELIKFGEDEFFSKIVGSSREDSNWELSVAVAGNKKRVKINGKIVLTYRDIFDFFRVITIDEDDLMLIKGSPELRRNYIDQAILLLKPEYSKILREYRKVLKQRNALLVASRIDKDSYAIWTEKLRELTHEIRNFRKKFLVKIEIKSNELLNEFFGEQSIISLFYKEKEEKNLFEKERLFKRTLFGSHLDDCEIFYKKSGSKKYSSRGQNKLVVMALKIAQGKILNKPVIFLIDDFMTDFDEKKVFLFLNILESTGSQLIFTSPVNKGFLLTEISKYNFKKIQLERVAI